MCVCVCEGVYEGFVASLCVSCAEEINTNDTYSLRLLNVVTLYPTYLSMPDKNNPLWI